MALKPDRQEIHYDISFFVDEVAEPGTILVHDTSGVGQSMDQIDANVVVPEDIAGVPAGLILNTAKDSDIQRVWADEVQIPGKATLLRYGWVVTNLIADGITPVAGEPAHFVAGGLLTNTAVGSGAKVGRWLSGKDGDGYAKVEILIQ
jgi:hypothetical protein